MQATSRAHFEAVLKHDYWRENRDNERFNCGGLTDDADRTLKAAEDADYAAVEVIRTELQGRGRPLSY